MNAQTRGVALICSASLAGWLLLAFAFMPRLQLAATTKLAAGVILAVQAGSLLYALRLAQRNHARGLAHLAWLASLCQILGLVGTVAGFLIVLTGGFAHLQASDPASVQHLLSRVAEGSATALVATLTGVVASVAISLAHHILSD